MIENLEILIDRGDVDFMTNPSEENNFRINGTAKGFGFPKNHVDLQCTESGPNTQCLISRHGFFSDYESNFKILVNPELVSHLKLTVMKGDLNLAHSGPIPASFHFNLVKKN